MSPTEVIGIEIKQYVGDGNLRTLVPRVVGQTEQARTQKIGGGRSQDVPVDWDYYRAWLQPERFTLVRSLFERIEEAIRERGLRDLHDQRGMPVPTTCAITALSPHTA